MKLHVPTPSAFNFRRTVRSHGWYSLLPFDLDQDQWRLRRVLQAGLQAPVSVLITQEAEGLLVETPGRLPRAAADAVVRQVRHVFRLDEDLDAFYGCVGGLTPFAWIPAAGAGRMLRSPTVYEDLVKSLCTTNCSWAMTEKMVTALVGALGTPAADGRQAFPTPAAMAAQNEIFYRETVRAGYRAPFLAELAQTVASGALDVEVWVDSPLPTDALKREMKQVKGVGDYAAENLLKLVGRYDVLALDSWVRETFARKHHGGARCEDARIARHYAGFGEWRGLVLWCDMTREWIDD